MDDHLHVSANRLPIFVNRCFAKIAVKVVALASQLDFLEQQHLILRIQWKDTEFIFIDEISMVPYEMFCMIDSRLRQLKNKEDEPFGGDLFQLPPIRGEPEFHQPSRFVSETY